MKKRKPTLLERVAALENAVYGGLKMSPTVEKCPRCDDIAMNAWQPGVCKTCAYMKGDKTLEPPKIMKIPTMSNKIIIGKSHHFFLTLRKSQSSLNKEGFFVILIYLFLNLSIFLCPLK